MTEETIVLDLGKEIITPVEGVVTKESLDTMLLAGSFDRLSAFESSGINKAQLEAVLATDTLIEDFWGGAEAPVAKLEEEVPAEFPNSLKVKMEEETYEVEVCEVDEEKGDEVCHMEERTKLVPVLDEEGEPVMIQKLWKEYCTNHRISVDKKTVLFKVGYTDSHGNLLHKVADFELRLWVDSFEIDNITVYKDWKTLLKSDKYTDNDPEL